MRRRRADVGQSRRGGLDQLAQGGELIGGMLGLAPIEPDVARTRPRAATTRPNASCAVMPLVRRRCSACTSALSSSRSRASTVVATCQSSVEGVAALVPRRLELGEHGRLLGLGGMDFEAAVAEPDVAQPPLHHLQRRGLLRHEQHRAAERQALRDDVGDGLALAGAGRPEQHEILAGCRRQHRGELGGVRRQRREQIGGVEGAVDGAPAPGTAAVVAIAVLGRVDEVLHHRIALEQRGALDQVLPHQELGEGERRQHHVRRDLPALARSRMRALRDLRKMRAMSRPLSSVGSSCSSSGMASWKSCRSISSRVGLKRASSSWAARRKPLRTLSRCSDTGTSTSGARQGFGARSVPACHGEEADGEEQDIGAAFLERRPRHPVELGQAGVELGLGEEGVKLAALLQRLQHDAAPGVVVPLGDEQRRLARVGLARARRSCGRSLKRLPAASRSSSRAGSGQSRATAVLLSVKFSSLLRSDRSSSLRFQRSSRSSGASLSLRGPRCPRRTAAPRRGRPRPAPPRRSTTTGGAGSAKIERPDAAGAGARDVDGEFQRVGGALVDQLGGLLRPPG